MTLLGFIFLAIVILGFGGLLSEGAKNGLNIDKWSDLWRSSDREKQEGKAFRVHIKGAFSTHTQKPNK